MAEITLRVPLGRPLTYQEVDNNFSSVQDLTLLAQQFALTAQEASTLADAAKNEAIAAKDEALAASGSAALDAQRAEDAADRAEAIAGFDGLHNTLAGRNEPGAHDASAIGYKDKNLYTAMDEVELEVGRVGGLIGLVIDDHNLDPNAHPDLRNLIGDGLDAHNHDPSAHPELSDFITSEANRAEAARDAAFVNADVYPDIASGLAAVADGEQFQVVVGDEIVRYRRDSSSSQTEVARYPSASVADNTKRARALIFGRVSSISYGSTSEVTIRITEPGYVYFESNSGAPFATIAPLSNSVTITPGYGLIVDLDAGPFDEFGRVIPQFAAIASNAQAGWQSGNRWVILAAGGSSSMLPILSGPYSMSRDEADRVSRGDVVGGYTVEEVSATGAVKVSLGEGRIFPQSGSGGVKTVAPIASTSLGVGKGLVVDLDGGPTDGQGRYIPQIETVSTEPEWQTGSRYILAANGTLQIAGADTRVVDTIFGGYKRVVAGAFDGAVAWQQLPEDPMPSWDAATRTLTWPNTFLMVDGFSSRINLLAGSVTFPVGGFWVAMLDMALANHNTNSNNLPPEAVIIKSYRLSDPGPDWTGLTGRYIPIFVVGYNSAYPVRFLPVRGSTTWPSGNGSGARKENLLIISNGSDEVKIYQPGSNPSSDGAVEIVYARVLDAERGADVWRLNGIYAATRSGNTVTRVRSICNTGEIEMAIKITGKSDHIGGRAHGDEISEEVTLLVNGVATPVDTPFTLEADTIEFIQESKLYEPDTAIPQSNHIATSWKRIAISPSEVEINNRVEWLQSFQLDQCFLSMLTALRDAAGSEVLKITDTGFRYPYWQAENIASAGHSPIYTKTPYIKLSGPSGYGFEMEILEGWDKPNREAYISPSPQYNKLYFDFTGADYVVEADEVMVAKSRFRVQNSN